MKLSVVVAPTEDGLFLKGAFAALDAQEGAPPFEIVVPVDDSIHGVDGLRRAYPSIRFIDVPGTARLSSSCGIGVAHVAIDRRRSAGLAASRGEIVALTEEHARPASDWCAGIVDCHQAPHGVIGGAIENATPRLVNWALYFLDAGRYQNPLPEGPSRFVSDVNVSYKRKHLESVRTLWEGMYHETGVHDALRAAGETLWLTPKLVVRLDRGQVGLARALRERFAWARLYAGRRSGEISRVTRFVYTIASPILALILPVRAGKTSFTRKRHRVVFLKTLPLLLLMSSVWAMGEFTGYLTGRATAGSAEAGSSTATSA